MIRINHRTVYGTYSVEERVRIFMFPWPWKWVTRGNFSSYVDAYEFANELEGGG